ncbi:uncharacterized protein LOC124542299 [Vanessa cardui]|uniref:uncharacterized protein LOC124542299 n=1 Tax=Vanessa cardui TaxID=171605 RepID=UPI001F142012|nr:uncharacterized protein LOC124542299 [Vanessa cardui]
MSNMDWTNETVLRFLELYQTHPCIWDPKHRSHKNKTRLSDAWTDIRDKLGEPCTVQELKKKKESLMAAYRGYRTKIKKSEAPAGKSELYRPTWFAYSLMDSFLGTVYKCTLPVSAEDKEHQHNQDIDEISIDDSDESSQEQKYSAQATFHSTNPSQPQLQSSPISKRHPGPQQTDQVKQMTHYEEDDECNIFGKLIAKKMRKLSEERRDYMMIRINQLFYTECHEQNMPCSSTSLPRTHKHDSDP